MSYVYIFEDHDYPTQEAAFEILRSVSDVKVCRPGTHDWRKVMLDGPLEVCDTCKLVREKKREPKDSIWVVFYKNHPTFNEDDQPLSNENFSENWTIVKSILAKGPDDVFMKMQGENWSPKGEARDLIRALGLRHTSMSVGDICLDVERAMYYCTLDVGFRVRNGGFGDGLKTYSPAATMTEEEAYALNEPDYEKAMEEEFEARCTTCDGDWGKPEKDCRDCVDSSYRAAIDEDDEDNEDDDRASEEEAHRRHLQSLENKAQHYYDEMERFQPDEFDINPMEPDDTDVFECEACGYGFAHPSDQIISSCPKCGFDGDPSALKDGMDMARFEPREEWFQEEDYAEALGRRREEEGSRHFDNTPEEF